MRLIILSLMLISLVSCNKDLAYPKQQLVNQLLRVRPDQKESLSTSYSNEKGELIIDYYGYNKEFVNTLRRLQFICYIANVRHKPCEYEGNLGFCHHFETCKGWWIFKKCKAKIKFVNIKEHDFLVNSNTQCFNRNKDN